jgi:hypothetical protein
MRLRVLAVLLLGVGLVPAWGQPVGPAGAGPGFPQDRVIGRQRITWLRPEPLPLMQERINRMRISVLVPPLNVGPAVVPAAAPPATTAPGGPVVPGPGLLVAPPVKGSAVEDCLIAIKWTCGRAIDDTCGRRWVLVHGDPHWDRPARLPGWVLRADGAALPYFFSRTGRMYRMVSPVPVLAGGPLGPSVLTAPATEKKQAEKPTPLPPPRVEKK